MTVGFKPSELTSCDRDPIHIPGSIQPHGIMLVAELESLRIGHIAGEIEHRLGSSEWIGLPLDAFIGEELSGTIRNVLDSGAVSAYIGRLQTRTGESLDVSAHLSAPFVIVEMETAAAQEEAAIALLDRLASAAASFERAASLTILCEKAATEFRRLTGFDRIMIYQFLDDGEGKVLAESKRDDLHSFLNHHFPQSDIPRQARALYIRNLVRVIPDVSYVPAVLRPDWSGIAPLDMSDSSLRSVAPIHLQYLRNMGVGASASVSIVKDGLLWGLIACHNETPRSLTYDVRAACRSLAGDLSRQIIAKEEAEGYRQRIRLRNFEDDILVLLSHSGQPDQALSNHLGEIGRMMDADGVAVLRGVELTKSGVCPSDSEILQLTEWVNARAIEPCFATDSLANQFPPAAAYAATGSGILAITLSPVEPWILILFRADQGEIVNWAGNPHKSSGEDPHELLTPRTSFEAWRQAVTGRARRWTLAESDAAARMRVSLLDLVHKQRITELNLQLTKILNDKDVLLQQKDFLVGEVNHRVQNSLQLVSSFLTLQARGSKNAELLAALEEARRRVSAIALVHRRLHRGDKIETVDAARYIEELCTDTFSFMGEDWAKHLTLNLAPTLIATDRAVTLGLIFTELLINCNKYAYGGAAGPIEINLIEDRAQLRLIVADKGVGPSSTPSKGLGSRIIGSLVSQLGGELILSDNHPGLRTALTMPLQRATPD